MQEIYLEASNDRDLVERPPLCKILREKQRKTLQHSYAVDAVGPSEDSSNMRSPLRREQMIGCRCPVSTFAAGGILHSVIPVSSSSALALHAWAEKPCPTFALIIRHFSLS